MDTATKKLELRLYSENDKNDFRKLFTDEKVMKFVDMGVMTLAQTDKLWDKLMKDFYPRGLKTIFAVFEKSAKKYIGHAAIRPRPTKKEDWEISYMLKVDEWGKGYATEIAVNLVKFGFEELNLSEVFATIDDDNFDSIKVVKKAGMDFLQYEFDEDGRFSVYSIKRPIDSSEPPSVAETSEF